MSVNLELLTNLSKIGLTEKEQSDFPQQLENMETFAAKLNELNTELPPSVFSHEAPNRMREDVVGPRLDAEKLFKNAPDSDGTGFIVPRVLE